MPQSSTSWAQRKAFDNRQKKGAKKGAKAKKETASAASRRPFFVYGTLMPGFKNYESVLAGRCAFSDPLCSVSPLPAKAPRAALRGASMVHYRAGFPGVKKCSDDASAGAGVQQRVYGRLVWATGTSKARAETLRRLDALEQYFGASDPRNEYDRVLLPVEVLSGETGEGEKGAAPRTRTLEAWVYLTRVATTAGNETAVPHGDWARFVEETGVVTAADDWHDELVKGEQLRLQQQQQAVVGTEASSPQATHSQWLCQTREAALDAARPIVDAHHHLWQRHPTRLAVRDYMLDAIAAEINDSGHNVVATVYMQSASAGWLDPGRVGALAAVAESEVAQGVHAMARTGRWGEQTRGVCSAIISTGDLLLQQQQQQRPLAAPSAGLDVCDGDGTGFHCCTEAEADVVLAAHCAAAPNFRGLRFFGGKVERFPFNDVTGVDGVLHAMTKRSLVLDMNGPEDVAALCFGKTLGAIAELAVRHPLLRVVIDHCGGAVGPALAATELEEWRDAMRALAALPNVYVKASGLQMAANRFGLTREEGRSAAPIGSEELATLTFPYYSFIIEHFGVERVMFASNFPVDKCGVGYGILWNTFKRIAQRLALDEAQTDALFSGTARTVYALQ